METKKQKRHTKYQNATFFIDFSQFIAPNAYTNVLFMTFWDKT